MSAHYRETADSTFTLEDDVPDQVARALRTGLMVSSRVVCSLVPPKIRCVGSLGPSWYMTKLGVDPKTIDLNTAHGTSLADSPQLLCLRLAMR